MDKYTRKRRTLKPPKYCHHKASGRAYVHLNGADHYLGDYGSEDSRKKYAKLIAEHSAGAIIESGQSVSSEAGITVVELVLRYIKHAENYYVKNGKITDEVACIRSAVRPLIDLYGDIPAANFGPMALMAVRQKMVDAKKVYRPKPPGKEDSTPGRASIINGGQFCRRFINQSVGRIRRMFTWGVSREFVDAMVPLTLKTLEPLLANRSDAKDYPERRPVPLADIAAVKLQLKSERTKDLIDLALLCGARPGELIKLTGSMIDQTTYKSKRVWIADLKDHKMAHKKKKRILVFGRKAQAILSRYMPDDQTKRLFEVSRASVSSTIKAACNRAGVPEFTTHWLRHNAGTRVRKDFGLDATQVTLGHANADTTEPYAELDLDKAITVAQKSG